MDHWIRFARERTCGTTPSGNATTCEGGRITNEVTQPACTGWGVVMDYGSNKD